VEGSKNEVNVLRRNAETEEKPKDRRKRPQEKKCAALD
jgi:hypothetical protein